MHFDSIILNNENNIRSIDEKASVTNSIAQKLNTLTRSNAQTAAQINDVVEKFNWHAQKYFANLLKNRQDIAQSVLPILHFAYWQNSIFRQIVQLGRRKATALLGRVVQDDGKDAKW